MASVVWLPSLPKRLELGASIEGQKGFILTPMSAGPPKLRKRFSATSALVTGKMKFSKRQRSIFETFFKETLSEGSEPFEWVDPADFTPRDFIFEEPVKWQALVGGTDGVSLWLATFKLRMLP